MVFLLPLDRPLFGLPLPARLALGTASWLLALVAILRGTPAHHRSWLALFIPLLILAASPINTDLSEAHIAILFVCFTAVVILPPLIIDQPNVITFRLLPDRLDPVDLGYTLLSIPLAWAAFELYFGLCSPEVPNNWALPPEPNTAENLKLFFGINGVGIWDELFFINICYAIFRHLYPARIAIPAQAVIYVTILYEMAFTGWGPLFVGFLALTQGLMYERARVLLWVLIVHLIVDYFLFQAIITHYYPNLNVWWH